MTDTPDSFTMIGLHKLASERDDGLIPELLAIYAAREKLAEGASLALDRSVVDNDDGSAKFAGNDNVIAFRPYLLARKRR